MNLNEAARAEAKVGLGVFLGSAPPRLPTQVTPIIPANIKQPIQAKTPLVVGYMHRQRRVNCEPAVDWTSSGLTSLVVKCAVRLGGPKN